MDLSRYDDIVEAARDWQTFSSSAGNMIDELPGRAGATLGTTDPPRHDRLRALSQAAFLKRNLDRMVERTRSENITVTWRRSRYHHPVWRLRRKNSKLSADHAQLELYGAALSAAYRNPERQVEISQPRAGRLSLDLHFRVWHLPDTARCPSSVRFRVQSGHP